MSKMDGNNGPKEQHKTVDPGSGMGDANGEQPAVDGTVDPGSGMGCAGGEQPTVDPTGNSAFQWRDADEGERAIGQLGGSVNNPLRQLSPGLYSTECSDVSDGGPVNNPRRQLAQRLYSTECSDGVSEEGPNAAAGERSGTETIVPTISKPKVAGEDQRLDTATETEVKQRLRATQPGTQFQSGKFYQLDVRGHPQKLSSNILFDPGSTTTGEGESKGEPDGVRPFDSASQVQSQTSSQRKPPEPIGSKGSSRVYSARLYRPDSVSQVRSQTSQSKPPETIVSVGPAKVYKQQRDDERQRVRQVQDENQRLRAEVERLHTRLLDIQDMQLESEQDVAARNVELDDDLQKAEEEIFRLTDRIDELERESEDAKRQVEAIAEDCGRLDQENTELKRQLTTQAQQTSAPSSELAKTCQLAQQKASWMQQEVVHKDQTIRELEQKIREAEQDSIRANREIDMRTGQLMEKDAELRQLNLVLKEADLPLVRNRDNCRQRHQVEPKEAAVGPVISLPLGCTRDNCRQHHQAEALVETGQPLRGPYILDEQSNLKTWTFGPLQKINVF